MDVCERVVRFECDVVPEVVGAKVKVGMGDGNGGWNKMGDGNIGLNREGDGNGELFVAGRKNWCPVIFARQHPSPQVHQCSAHHWVL